MCEHEFDDIGKLYTLDACSHRFCYPCIRQHIGKQLQTHLPSEVTCSTCATSMSVRDLHDFIRVPSKHKCLSGATGTSETRKRLMRELMAVIQGHDSEMISVVPVCDNLYEWDVYFGGFSAICTDPDDKEGQAEAALGRDLSGRSIQLRVHFPERFPWTPPFVRVVRPRFKFHTGHVTVGGSICTHMLTSSGWDASITMESVLIAVRHGMIKGGGRIDKNSTEEYSESEAREAFDRVRRDHGW